MNITQQLLNWYDNNKRDLPWRRDKDPYKIWVSEIMLQQTRVEAVKPYFERWIERYPTVESLAAADDQDVLYNWQGLGYYSRARNLHKGVREVAAQYNGKVPDTREHIERLSGIGEYTAGAVLSIAYNKHEPAVDGNVLRIFSRLFGLDDDITLPAAKRAITQLVQQEMSPDRPGDFNQALMDLGATICISKTPRCEKCPLFGFCMARQQGREKELPIRKKRTPPLKIRLCSAIIQDDDGCYLLCKRPDKGLLASQWEFPTVEGVSEHEEMRTFATLFEELGQHVSVEQKLFSVVHTFSHRQWLITFYRCSLQQTKDIPAGKSAAWVLPDDFPMLSLAGPHRKAVQRLQEQ